MDATSYRIVMMQGVLEQSHPRAEVVYNDFGHAVLDAVQVFTWATLAMPSAGPAHCLYVLTDEGEVKFVIGLPDLSVLGWEPDKE